MATMIEILPMKDTPEVTVAHLRVALAEVIDRVERGETVLITRRGRVVARLSPPSGRETRCEAATDVAREVRTAYGTVKEDIRPSTQQGPLSRLVGEPTLRAVLGIFLLDPSVRIHQREIARQASANLRSVQVALDRLERAGVLRAERSGNRLYYSAIESEQFNSLREALSPEIGLVAAMRDALGRFGDAIEAAFIFGSVARGDDRIGSDVDLLVVGDVPDRDLFPAIGEVERRLGREVNVLKYRREQFERLRANDSHFVRSVLAGARIDLFGHVE